VYVKTGEALDLLEVYPTWNMGEYGS